MEINSPVFSIIIPTYNRCNLLKRCLDSVINQTYPNWEAIIIDNNSNDSTLDLLKSYIDERIVVINNPIRIIAVSRNLGIKTAKGDWICFLDSDDWWNCNKLEVCSHHLADSDFIYHNCITDSGKKIISGDITDTEISNELIIQGNPFVNSSIVIRKSIINAIGLMDESPELKAIEDFDYWIRVSLYTKRFYYIDKILGTYYIGENSASQNIMQVKKEKLIYLKYAQRLSVYHKIIAYCKMHFRCARIYHSLKYYRKASIHYLISCLLLTDPLLVFKSLIGIILSSLHIVK